MKDHRFRKAHASKYKIVDSQRALPPRDPEHGVVTDCPSCVRRMRQSHSLQIFHCSCIGTQRLEARVSDWLEDDRRRWLVTAWSVFKGCAKIAMIATMLILLSRACEG